MFVMIAAGIAAAATMAEMYETGQAEEMQLERLNIQRKERQLQLSQKRLSIYDQTKKTINRQVAQASVRGMTMDSPSFNAIQRETINISSKYLQNLTTEQEVADYNISAEKANTRMTTHAKLFGETASLAMSFAQMKGGYDIYKAEGKLSSASKLAKTPKSGSN